MTQKSIVNIISSSNCELRRVTRRFVEKLKNLNFALSLDFNQDAILVIAVGGDGVFIRAVNKATFSSIPVVGINTGHLGSHQEIIPDQLDDFLKAHAEGDYMIEELSLIGAEVFTKNRSSYPTTLNEIVVKVRYSRVIHLNLFLNRNRVGKFSGDGMLVATPSGSTGYNFSAGGSLVYPTVEVLEITPLNPLISSAHRDLSNSIVTPGDTITIIVPERRYANSSLLMVDGVEYTYQQLRKIDIRMSKRRIQRITLNKDDYWTNLKSKFL